MSWSARCVEITGPVPRGLDGYLERVHPVDREEVRRLVERLTGRGVVVDHEHRIVRLDGALRRVRLAASPQPGSRGRPVQVVGALTDLTDQPATALLDTLVESLDVAVVRCDAQGQLLEGNAFARRVTGIEPHELRGMDLATWCQRIELCAPDGHTRIPVEQSPLMQALRIGQVRDREVVVRAAPGRPRRLLVHAGAVRDGRGQLLGAVAAGHDITELREQEEVTASAVNQVVELAGAARAILADPDPRSAVCAAARRTTGARHAALLEPDPDGVLLPTAGDGLAMAGLRCPPGNPAAVWQAWQQGRPALVGGALAGWPAAPSYAVLPVVGATRPLGVLVVGRSAPWQVEDAEQLAVLEVLASEAAVAIERHQMLSELQTQARTDPLTGLMNRREWEHQLAGAIAAAERSGLPLCLAILDLDHFKDFNDTYGHPAGDALLQDLAAGWRSRVRRTDGLARLGGEEFGLLLCGAHGPQALDLVNLLRTRVPGGQTATGGVAEWRAGESARDLLDRADRALYAAKAAGRDRSHLAD
ncbi:MAG: sensor domain-containing diguanylate cyclase [Mycobacteriales bacterium]